jgi:hypothetical protein
LFGKVSIEASQPIAKLACLTGLQCLVWNPVSHNIIVCFTV